MDTDFTLKTRASFTITETILIDFTTYIKIEKRTLPKMITQFMFNYIEHLDSSFLKNNHQNKVLKTKYIAMSIPDNVYSQFKQKTEEEGVKMSKIIEQFMQKYNDFMKNCQKGIK
ncbi:MAG: hypothetical protein JJV89_01290 [Desulfosarcina sp.]|nr:hypothetical protein [Desulfobacterales bacterium]